MFKLWGQWLLWQNEISVLLLFSSSWKVFTKIKVKRVNGLTFDEKDLI